MSAPRKPRAAAPDPLERLNQKEHARAQMEQIGLMLDAKIAGALALHPTPAPASPLPRWLTAVFATAAGVVSIAAVVGVVLAVLNAYAGTRVEDSAVLGRIVALEAAKADAITAAGRLEARLEAARGTAATATGEVENRLRTVENTIATATRIRDQNEQSARDRLRALEQADSAYATQLNNLATTIASILPRLEEILRRQERLENRLGARPGSAEDEPASLSSRPIHRL